MLGNDPQAHAATAAHHGGVEVWLGRPDAASDFDLATLGPADRERFATIHTPRRREEFKVSRVLLARARGAGSAITSLSHSGGYAALLRAPSGLSVGVDLEIHQSRDVLRLARNVFSAAEIQALQAAQGSHRDRLFYALWTMKEALAKALQLNLMDALRQCTFMVRPGIWSGSVPTRSKWSVLALAPEEGMCLAVALLQLPSPPRREESGTGLCLAAGPHPVLPPPGGGRDAHVQVSRDAIERLELREWPSGQRVRWPIITRAAAPALAAASLAAAPQAAAFHPLHATAPAASYRRAYDPRDPHASSPADAAAPRAAIP